ALKDKGDLVGAIARFRRAIALQPRYARAHVSLGLTLVASNDLSGAIACFRKAVALDPRLAPAHYSLGKALHASNDLPGAIASSRKAIALDPPYAEAPCTLGAALLNQGRFAQPLRCYRRGHELGSRRRNWPYPSAQWVRQARRLADLEARLPGLLAGA